MSENPGLSSSVKDYNNRKTKYRLISGENNYESTSIVYVYLHVRFCEYIYKKVKTAA